MFCPLAVIVVADVPELYERVPAFKTLTFDIAAGFATCPIAIEPGAKAVPVLKFAVVAVTVPELFTMPDALTIKVPVVVTSPRFATTPTLIVIDP